MTPRPAATLFIDKWPAWISETEQTRPDRLAEWLPKLEQLRPSVREWVWSQLPQALQHKLSLMRLEVVLFCECPRPAGTGFASPVTNPSVTPEKLSVTPSNIDGAVVQGEVSPMSPIVDPLSPRPALTPGDVAALQRCLTLALEDGPDDAQDWMELLGRELSPEDKRRVWAGLPPETREQLRTIRLGLVAHG